MNKDNVMDIYAYAKEYKNEEMVTACFSFFVRHHEWFLEQDAFHRMEYNEMLRFSCGLRKCQSARDCFLAIKFWCKQQEPGTLTKENLSRLMETIDWTDISEASVIDMMMELDDREMRYICFRV